MLYGEPARAARLARGQPAVEEQGGEALLAFELRFTDRDGRRDRGASGLLIGVADPTVHDLDDYGRAKGVVLVSIDTLRRDHVGTYGYAKPTTPRSTRWAPGIVAEDAVSTSSWTLPGAPVDADLGRPGAHGGVDMSTASNHASRRSRALQAAPATGRRRSRATSTCRRVYGLDEGSTSSTSSRTGARATSPTARSRCSTAWATALLPLPALLRPALALRAAARDAGLFESKYAGKVTGLWGDFSKKTATS
jgi:hypothetical protein